MVPKSVTSASIQAGTEGALMKDSFEHEDADVFYAAIYRARILTDDFGYSLKIRGDSYHCAVYHYTH
jgi:hypothetical protein